MKILVCSFAILLAASTGAGAKPLSRILSESGLSADDFDIMGNYAASLYDRGNPRAGSSATWTNPASGASGTVTLAEIEGNCVRLRHEATPGSEGKRPVVLRTRRCKNADGIWMLQP